MTSAMIENENDVDYYSLAKKELDDSILLSEIWLVPLILALYFILVIAGKKDLINKKPMDLKFIILIYNIFQIFYNAYMAYQTSQPDTLNYLFNHGCKPVNPAANKLWLKGIRLGLLFYISKLIDLLDTVFIILRKRSEKVSFLHLYHHAGMVFYPWIMVKFNMREQLAIIGLLNSSVHVIMYTYYTLTLMGPSIRKYLWWKRYVTILQLGQFVILFAYMGAILALGCPQPNYVSFFVIIQVVIFFKLFKDFYDENYASKSVKAKQAEPTEKKAT